jgi:uncharacterized tellurite resistance protein B-like protein
MDFTYQEKKAIYCILVKLMKADGHTDLREAAALFQISKEIDISVNEADFSLKMTLEDAKSTITGLNSDKKAYVSNLFNEMITSDGKIDNKELTFIKNIFSE